MKFKFRKDDLIFYITPLIGYSDFNGHRTFWAGWLHWLLEIEIQLKYKGNK